ncbi:MAG: hypothetical protein ABSG63_15730 [Spirochaetia bacterium]
MKVMISGGRHLVILVFVAPLLFACATKPATATTVPETTQVPAAQNPSGAEFVATEEYYRKTFAEVQDVIAALTRIIAAEDYAAWRGYLSEDYVETTSSPAFLAAASNSGVLKKNGIVLRSLKDYFDNVVVRSRVQATLDDITFVDARHVKAITQIQGSSVILYYLEREDGRWKVAVLRTGQN